MKERERRKVTDKERRERERVSIRRDKTRILIFFQRFLIPTRRRLMFLS